MTWSLFLYIMVMALVTYLIRMLPFVFFTRKINSPFVKSFFYYIPYTILGAMTVPAVFYSTGSIFTAAAGFIVAAILAFKKDSLILVALAACVAAYLASLIEALF